MGINLPKFVVFWTISTIQDEKSAAKFDYIKTVSGNVVAQSIALRDFHKICRVCTSFQDALGVKILLDLLKGLWSYGGFKFRGSGCPQIFSAP